MSLEIALLVSLCSANKDVCDEASKCIGYLCREFRIVDADEEDDINSTTFNSNVKIYQALSSDDSRFIGRKAQQKRIRKYLRMLPQHTPGNMAAWEEAWKRWKNLTVLMSKLSEDVANDSTLENNSTVTNTANGLNNSTTTTIASSTTATSLANNKKAPLMNGRTIEKNRSNTIIKPQQNLDLYEVKAIEWQNFTGFLAALGGCCLAETDDASLESSRRSSSPTEPSIMVDRFIGEMSEMLVSDNVYIREGVKDTLGNDLSPTLYVILFRHLEAHLNTCFDANGDAIRSPHNKLFVEQSVLVLRLILDRLIDPEDCLLNIDFSVLVHRFAEYLNKLPNTYITLRVKIKMCLLVEAVMQKKEHIVIRDEMRLRNKLLEISVEWTSDFALVSIG